MNVPASIGYMGSSMNVSWNECNSTPLCLLCSLLKYELICVGGTSSRLSLNNYVQYMYM